MLTPLPPTSTSLSLGNGPNSTGNDYQINSAESLTSKLCDDAERLVLQDDHVTNTTHRKKLSLSKNDRKVFHLIIHENIHNRK